MMQPNQGGGLGPSGVLPQSTAASMMTNTNSSGSYTNQNHYMAASAGSVMQMQQQQHQMPMPHPSPPGVRMVQQQHHHQMAQFGMANVGGHSPLSGGARPPGQGHPVFIGSQQQQQQNQSMPSHLVAGQQHQQQIQISQAQSPGGPYTLMNSPQQRNPMAQQGQQGNLGGPFQQTSQPQAVIQRPPQLTQYAVVTNAMPLQQQNPMVAQQQQFHPNQQPPNLSNSIYQQQSMQMQAQQQQQQQPGQGQGQGQMPRLPMNPSPAGGPMGQNQQQQMRPMAPNQPQQQQPQMPPGFIVHQTAPNQAPVSTTSSSSVNLNLNLLSTQSSNASLSGPPLSNQLSQSSTLSGGSTQPAPSTADFDSPGAPVPPLLTKQRLDDLTREIDPFEQLDDDVKEALLQYADEFIENVANSACQLAKHRKSSTLEVQDVKLTLERNWDMWIPGFGVEDIRPYKKACVTEAHKQRMALIKKTLRKI